MPSWTRGPMPTRESQDNGPDRRSDASNSGNNGALPDSHADPVATPLPLVRLEAVIQRDAVERERCAERERGFRVLFRDASADATREGHTIDRHVAELHSARWRDAATAPHRHGGARREVERTHGEPCERVAECRARGQGR